MNFQITFKKNHRSVAIRQSGFGLVELVVSVGVFGLLALGLTLFGRNIFSYNTYIQSDLNAQIEGRRMVTRMVSELREMSPSSAGAYPIAAAATSSLTFFSDIDNDSLKEQVRYYVSGTQVLRSVVEPTGSPLAYSGSPVVSTVVSKMNNGTSTALFEYYDTNYAGTTTALSLPINIPSVRLVKITVLLPRNPKAPTTSPLVITSQVTPRNLKDNL